MQNPFKSEEAPLLFYVNQIAAGCRDRNTTLSQRDRDRLNSHHSCHQPQLRGMNRKSLLKRGVMAGLA